MTAAVPTALGLIAVLVASVWFSPWPFVGLVAVAVALAMWELAHALRGARISLPFVPLALGGAGTQVAAALAGPPGALAGLVATAAAAGVWVLVDTPRGRLGLTLHASIFALVYLPVMATFATLLVFADQGRWLVLLLVALPVASDTGGFFAGSYLGRHPLAPTVSPKKTWEGLGGSVVLAVAVGLAAMALLKGPLYLGVVLGLVGVATATLGDLAESLLKRALALKDMGRLLPGHGGVLDRLDSIIMTAPWVYLVLTAWQSGVFA
jgi:phosphatidate cytidylyltransferase